MSIDELALKRAEQSALLSLLNLTALPLISFILLLFLYKNSEQNGIDRYYAILAIKTNLLAAVALFLVTTLMVVTLGGFDSAWTWVYVISYFVFVHAMFILFATWTMVRSWTGKKLTRSFLSK